MSIQYIAYINYNDMHASNILLPKNINQGIAQNQGKGEGRTNEKGGCKPTKKEKKEKENRPTMSRSHMRNEKENHYGGKSGRGSGRGLQEDHFKKGHGSAKLQNTSGNTTTTTACIQKMYMDLHENDFKALQEKMLLKKLALTQQIRAQYQLIYEHLLTSQRSLYGDIAKHYKLIYNQMKLVGNTDSGKEDVKYKQWQQQQQKYKYKQNKSKNQEEYLQWYSQRLKERVNAIDAMISSLRVQFNESMLQMIYNFAVIIPTQPIIPISTSPLYHSIEKAESLIHQLQNSGQEERQGESGQNADRMFSSIVINVVQPPLLESCQIQVRNRERNSDLTATVGSRLHQPMLGCSRKRHMISKSVTDLSQLVCRQKEKEKEKEDELNKSQLMIEEKIRKEIGDKSTGNLDLSNCKLTDTELYGWLVEVRKNKKINCVRLGNNNITNAGIAKCIPLLDQCNNINLSDNKISQQIVDILITNKRLLPKLKIVDIGSNKINERAIQHKIDQLRKYGIFIKM